MKFSPQLREFYDGIAEMITDEIEHENNELERSRKIQRAILTGVKGWTRNKMLFEVA